ncbi:MAG: PVC-type heme-binding CxxCH protein [Pirellulaceae bacterium]|nr:PVC-type heme-binding CxxCH protein [Pirellulaceae bacterium]
MVLILLHFTCVVRISAADSIVGAAEPASPSAWYGEGVRSTDARSPQDELVGFHLPPGFEARLFAAEPQIAKPLNLAFDYRGRMWITDSFEYPYPAPEGNAGRDSVRVLEDADGDGFAEHSSIFADGLNIPIGVLPYGTGCICFSIPNLYYLQDSDGDGVCDRRDVVLGPFDTTRDTHGMINSLRLGNDGWIYANHGFNNQSRIAGSDGHEISMHSGNSFRFKPDGSRIELVTSGQVNPFGRTTDNWGYDYTADCHSKPISQLIAGGCYPSFGGSHDGLGFVPSMMDHLHGSTAISGLLYIPSSLGIPALADQMLSGNVMTSRINRNRVVYRGATAKADELPDFLTSDDPWFRPVDIQLGPDGHIYIADFYNRIIGHYEVPLEHPGRDRFRGRIWQIRYVAAETKPPIPIAQVEDPTALWKDSNPARRRLGLQRAIELSDERIDRLALNCIADPELQTTFASVTAIGYLMQRGLLQEQHVSSFANDPSPIVRTHLLRVLGEEQTRNSISLNVIEKLSVDSLLDESPNVQRMGAEILGSLSQTKFLPPLLDALDRADRQDSILRQTIRIAIRNLLQLDQINSRTDDVFRWELSDRQQRELTEVMLAVRTELAGTYLMHYLEQHFETETRWQSLLGHIAQCLSSDRLPAFIALARKFAARQPSDEALILKLVTDAIGNSPKATLPDLREWLSDFADRNFQAAKRSIETSEAMAMHWSETTGKTWSPELRKAVDGRELQLFSSFSLGESYTGILQSEPFSAPDQISLWIAGHNSKPGQIDQGKNRIELLDASTNQVLETIRPPRSDIARKVEWKGSQIAGRSLIIRCTDGDSAKSYAWIAIGDFQPNWLTPNTSAQPIDRFLTIVTTYRLTEQRRDLVALIDLVSPAQDIQVRIGAAIADLDKRKLLSVLLSTAAEFGASRRTINPCLKAARDGTDVVEFEQASQLAKQLSSYHQDRFAKRLASDVELIPTLVELVDQGSISTDVLLDKEIWGRISAIASPEIASRAAQLRRRAMPIESALDDEMTDVLKLMDKSTLDEPLGRELFTQHCAVCHQIAGQGKVVGPQLDGIGGRGARRLLEDTMLPDRNVDKAFRTTAFLTVDGKVIQGLVRDENADRVLIAIIDGSTLQIATQDIEQRRDGTTSLMPSNFHQTLGAEKLAAIICYLIKATTHPEK